jgi:hypothetical protein
MHSIVGLMSLQTTASIRYKKQWRNDAEQIRSLTGAFLFGDDLLEVFSRLGQRLQQRPALPDSHRFYKSSPLPVGQ